MKNCPRGGRGSRMVRVAGPGTTVVCGICAGPAGGSLSRPSRGPRVSRRPRTMRRARACAARLASSAGAPRPGASRRQRRVCAQAAASLAAPRPRGPECVGPEDVPTYASVYAWLRRHLPGRGYAKPVCKRLAVLVSGLLVKRDCTLGALAAAVDGLAVSGATAESIERRLRRALHDDRLDPTRALPALIGALLPTLLAEVLERHAASARHAGRRHAGRLLVRVVVDDTSHTDRVHVLVAGLAYRGLVVPLLVRTWAQNEPLPAGQYRTELHGLLADVQALLPPALREHVLLVADRAFGVPWMLDLLAVLGWHWLLRVQGQTRVRLRDGTTRPLRSLVPGPGATWFGRFDPRGGDPADPAAVTGVFKTAGWRASQVVAAWTPGADEPWLLLTSLNPTPACLREYARRWGIERLVLCWKSHGWDLEASRLRDPAHARPPRAVRQLPLPIDADRPLRRDSARPHAAKRSLFTRGTDLWEAIAGKRDTPPVLWQFPDWDAPTWATQARHAYRGLTP